MAVITNISEIVKNNMRLNIKNYHKYSDNTSQIISWGHWFTLFNIFIVIILGSRYVFIADWPATFGGRFYAIVSSIGQFSFLCFAFYVILLFPLSFIIRSARYTRLMATVIATIGITLLLIDIEIFSRFRMHLNLTIWEIVSATDDNALSREWQRLFIFVPLIFLVELLFSFLIWKKLRSLTKRRRYTQPLIFLLIASFFLSHFIHIWADANFYRPITMQRSSLPLSYPMTARHFLIKYGFISYDNTSHRNINQGNPFAIAIEYPLGKIEFNKVKSAYNLLMITVDDMAAVSLTRENTPFLNDFAAHNQLFTHHYTASNVSYLGLFSLFYGIDPNYYNSIMANHEPSVLLDTITKQQYSLGLFSSDGFDLPFYRNTLLSNFSLPPSKSYTNKETTDHWLQWMGNLGQTQRGAPWFSFINYQLFDKHYNLNAGNQLTVKNYEHALQRFDKELSRVIHYLDERGVLNNTVIVITAAQGVQSINGKISLRHAKNEFEHQLLHVPLVISWPGKPATVIEQETSHTDITRTLMQDLLQVTTPAEHYSQGANLFALPSARDWLIAGNETNLVALYSDKTVIIDTFGHYKIYDKHNNELKQQKLDLGTFLQLVTANRRFMVTH
ncbi:MAG: DUF3413 domain-containing protein [Candidatus Schmidhempelia sp.]|nr:DUF3413 domain-containing protein [Candidatus Schmidhempelia sp.]